MNAINNLFFAALCMGCFLAGYGIKGVFVQAEREAEMLRIIKERSALDFERTEAERMLNDARAIQRKKTNVVIKKVNHEIKKPVYGECLVPDDGVRLINEIAGLYAAK